MKIEKLTVPVENRPQMEWGSDAITEVLSQLDLPFISLTPGASYRGVHDSLVNYLGNTKPEMILCLHEENAVAVAQGYAKVTGKPMAVALHSNVGLMHATMAIFNAYCDRMPMVILGATGPLDATERRPWIDWIHTATDQAALIRNYIKWDDQPGSVTAAVESLARANQVTRSYPCAPTYVVLDAGIQEQRLSKPVQMPNLARYLPPTPPAPPSQVVDETWRLLNEAKRPLILMGRVSRTRKSWDDRVRLVEALGACVLTDLKVGAVFPTKHPLQPAWPGARITPAGRSLIRDADLILSLDWVDLGGTLQTADSGDTQTVISCTNDQALHNGWSKDHYVLPKVDLSICADPNSLVDALLVKAEGNAPISRIGWPPKFQPAESATMEKDGEQLLMSELAASMQSALAGRKVTWTGLPLGWSREELDFNDPLDYLGRDGGGGVGAGPGVAVGAALALAGTDRLPVAVIGDGDYLMASSALWTAAHHRLPLLVVVANNRAYYNDEVHQQRVAITRGRPVENRWVGQHLRDPDPDLATIARGHGLKGFGPVRTTVELEKALAEALSEVDLGNAALIDVWISPRGYEGAPPEMSNQGRG